MVLHNGHIFCVSMAAIFNDNLCVFIFPGFCLHATRPTFEMTIFFSIEIDGSCVLALSDGNG